MLAGNFELMTLVRELLVTGFELLEQSDILNGDDCLISDGFQYGFLCVVKRTNFSSADLNHTKSAAFPQ